MDVEYLILLFVSLILCTAAVLGVWWLIRLLAWWLMRRMNERAVVGQIAAVVRQNLPLATGLALAAESEVFWVKDRLRRISALLGQGARLSEAMRLGFPDCSGLVLSLVEAGEKAGQLPAALGQAEEQLVEQARRRQPVDVSVWPYMVFVFAFMFLVVSGIMVAIIPKFKCIFEDFQVELPAQTESLIAVSEWFVSGYPPGWLLFAVPVVALGCYQLWRGRRRLRLWDWIRWHMPGLRRVEFGEGMAVMLRLMRSAVGSGMSLESAAGLASGLDVNRALRRRMGRFAALVAAGSDIRQATRSAQLGEVAGIALAAGQRSGNMDAALRYAADYYDAIVSRWWIAVRKLSFPVGTLFMSVFVAWVLVAVFTPLVTLIQGTCDTYGR